MANTVAYNNSSNPVGSIKKGVVSINIDNSLITSGLTWRNGIEFTNQYIIYSDTYTQGIDTQPNAKPCAWSCAYNDIALRDLINSLPPLIGQPKYNTLADAIAWLEGQNKYFLVNQNYPEIVTSGMTLCLDAGMTGSYPNAGTTWYDLSGRNANMTLSNGPTFVNSGTTSYISFDGSDDYGSTTVSVPDSAYGDRCCFDCVVYGPITDNTMLMSWGSQIHDIWIYGGGIGFNTYNSDVYGISKTPLINKWFHMTINFFRGDYTQGSIYVNGVQQSLSYFSSSQNTNNARFAGGQMRIASGGDNSYFGNWKFNTVKVYNRVLSQSEILQNYYKGKLVTSGLTLALDAGNLVSYLGASTTWYDMTSNANNGTLTNGPVYSGGTVPSLVFDGTNDYVSLPQSLLPNNFTYSIWVMRDGEGNQGTRGIVISNGSTYIDVGFQNNIMFSLMLSGGTQNLIQSANGVIAPFGVWGHYTATYNQQQAKLYYNGVEVGSSNYTLPPTNDFNTFIIGAYAGGGYNLNGKISNAQYYNRALSASEISQNFNTYRRRYGI